MPRTHWGRAHRRHRRRRWLWAIVVVVGQVSAACGGGGGGASGTANGPGKSRATIGGAPLAPCDQAPPLPASGTEAFGPGQSVESALGSNLGLNRDQVGIPAAVTAPSEDRSTNLPWVGALQRHLLDVPGWAQTTVEDLTASARTPCAIAKGEVLPRAIAAAGARLDTGASATEVRPQPVPDLDAGLDPANPLRAAFETVFATNDPWPQRPAAPAFAATRPTIDALASSLDPETNRALARVVAGMAKAEEWRLAAMAPWFGANPDFTELSRISPSGMGDEHGGGGGHDGMGDGPDGHAVAPAKARSFDATTMARAGAALAWAVERLAVHLQSDPLPDSVDFHLATPLGEVAISGRPTDDAWQFDAPALIVDQRGNDTYRGVVAAPAIGAVPFSAVVDVSGDDHYDANGSGPTQGAGDLGFGILVDTAGNDAYTAGDDAQGIGVLGVGALLDAAGNDTYTARYDAQGAGQLGVGVAIDLGGDDRRRLVSDGQGFGGVRGAGVLVDTEGNDDYVADDTNIVKPSAQSPEHNTSEAQGAASGTRTGDRAGNLGGGLGVLADLGGDDRYSCGLFCQGAGYFFAHGILYDAAGSDDYTGVWYTQGAGAHFALGTLLDAGGDDTYTAQVQMAGGAGHDRSGGFLVDGGGNDRSTVRTLSHGAGNDGGFGFYVDAGGDDRYQTDPSDPAGAGAYGQSVVDRDYRNASRTAGATAVAFFADNSGADIYEAAPAPVTNGATWKLPAAGDQPPAGLVGFGQDTG